MMEVGNQIAYIPTHAEGDIDHPDVEFGFITGFNSQGDPFCRYWRKGEVGVLRTTANSECTPIDMVIEHWSVPQSRVDGFIQKHYS
jgi:hypothetical protein